MGGVRARDGARGGAELRSRPLHHTARALAALLVLTGLAGSAEAVALRVTTTPPGTQAIQPGEPVRFDLWLVLAPGEKVRRVELDLAFSGLATALSTNAVPDLLDGALPTVPWGQEAVLQSVGVSAPTVLARYANAADLDLAALALLLDYGLVLDGGDGLPLGSIEGVASGSGWLSLTVEALVCSSSSGPCAGPLTVGQSFVSTLFSDDGSGCAAQGLVDADGDGLCSPFDLCPDWASANNADVDGNGIGDECECGDVSGDGTVNLQDVFALQQLILSGGMTPLCDVNGDGSCNLLDTFGIQEKTLGGTIYCDRYPAP